MIPWAKAAVWGWVAILTILAGYELWDVFGKDPYTPPLTQITVKYVPWWVTLPFIVWLLVHFSLRYFNPAYIASLRGK